MTPGKLLNIFIFLLACFHYHFFLHCWKIMVCSSNALELNIQTYKHIGLCDYITAQSCELELCIILQQSTHVYIYFLKEE